MFLGSFSHSHSHSHSQSYDHIHIPQPQTQVPRTETMHSEVLRTRIASSLGAYAGRDNKCHSQCLGHAWNINEIIFKLLFKTHMDILNIWRQYYYTSEPFLYVHHICLNFWSFWGSLPVGYKCWVAFNKIRYYEYMYF